MLFDSFNPMASSAADRQAAAAAADTHLDHKHKSTDGSPTTGTLSATSTGSTSSSHKVTAVDPNGQEAGLLHDPNASNQSEKTGFFGITDATAKKVAKGFGIGLLALVAAGLLATGAYYIHEYKDVVGQWFTDQAGGIVTGAAIIIAVIGIAAFLHNKSPRKLGMKVRILIILVIAIAIAAVGNNYGQELFNKGFSQWQGLMLVGSMAIVPALIILGRYLNEPDRLGMRGTGNTLSIEDAAGLVATISVAPVTAAAATAQISPSPLSASGSSQHTESSQSQGSDSSNGLSSATVVDNRGRAPVAAVPLEPSSQSLHNVDLTNNLSTPTVPPVNPIVIT